MFKLINYGKTNGKLLLSDHVNRPIPTSGTEVEVGGVL